MVGKEDAPRPDKSLESAGCQGIFRVDSVRDRIDLAALLSLLCPPPRRKSNKFGGGAGEMFEVDCREATRLSKVVAFRRETRIDIGFQEQFAAGRCHQKSIAWIVSPLGLPPPP